MKRKIEVRKVSVWYLVATAVFSVLFAVVTIAGNREFRVLKNTTDQYINCENAAKQLQDGSDYLTEQVRLYTMTGDSRYTDLYFKEATETRRRENAIEELRKYFAGTETFDSLQAALDCSEELMSREYYAMRLVAEAKNIDISTWPEEIKKVVISKEDRQLDNEGKMERAQQLVCDDDYQDARVEITEDVTKCVDSLITQTENRQNRATSIFSDMYFKLEIGIVVMIALIISLCVMVTKLVVTPLLSYNESIKRGEIFPVIGAAELQSLAETYNRMYRENEETQKLIRHQAEHDALTDILNRGSFEKILNIYEKGDNPYALIVIDVDIFKSVNDTYGHAVGDTILKNVANDLKMAFRSIDYVCRIGGDEFAVIMVEMTSDLAYTIQEKVDAVNEKLAHPEEGIPAVSLSVGVAFSDRENPGDSIFKDADKALYHVKENGRNGCWFYKG